MRATKETPVNKASAQMRAIVPDTYSSAEVLELETIDRSAIGANDVFIEVAAAGLDRGVEHLMTGLLYLIRLVGYGLAKPKNRGLHVGRTSSAVSGSHVDRDAQDWWHVSALGGQPGPLLLQLPSQGLPRGATRAPKRIRSPSPQH
jgi:hypothetical protein